MKGIVEDGKIRLATLEDSRQERICDVIIVNLVVNSERSWNREYSSNPPTRTGYFEWFMDKVESFAEEFGIQYVLVSWALYIQAA